MKKQLPVSVKTIVAILFVSFIAISPVFAQLHGTYTIDNTIAASATNYKNFTSAAGDLNSGTRTDGGTANGPGATGDVTFNVAAGEVFQESPVIITYANNPNWYDITFENSGTPGTDNPILEGTNGVGDSDAVIKLLGGSYYTFNGINFSDNQSNTTPNTEMEYGIYLSALTAFGCQYNTFENGTITLNNTNTNLPTGVYTNSDGVSGAGANSYNTFTNLIVQNVITGYSLNGSENTGVSADYGNVINTANGGRSEVTNVGTTASNNGTVVEGIFYNGENTLNISNTSINDLAYYNTSSAGAVYGIIAGDGGIGIATGTVTFNADSLQSLRVEGGSPSTATIEGIYLGSVTTTTNITNCQMQTFISTGSGASIYGIDMEAGVTTTTTVNISGNTMNNFVNLGGDILGFNDGPVSNNTNYLNIFNNDFSNFSCSVGGAYTVYGVQLSSQSLSFHNNKLSSFIGGTGDGLAGVGVIGLYLVAPTGNLTQFHDDTLTGFTAPTSITGIEESFFTPSSISIYNCVFSNFSTTSLSTGSITGLTASITSDTVYDNHVYTFSNPATDGKIIGLEVSAAPGVGTPDIVYNNMVYDLQANNSTISTNGGAVVGIELPNVDNAGAAVEFYDNTVLLNGTATVAGQYSSALFARAAVGTVLNGYDIRNNILVNDYSVPDANDHAVAFWYNNLNSSFQGIATTSNNNLLYAGTPSGNNLIFYCKASDSVQTLSVYKTLLGAGKEAKSVTENPPFMSVVPPINVHINNTIYTQAESGGQVITSPAINTDIDGNIRAGSVGYTGCGTAPDIGASEFCGIPDTAFGITGPSTVNQGQTGITFSVSPIPDATGYNWILPGGATITSGANTNSITVNFSGVNTGADSIYVWATNCCGNGVSNSIPLAVDTVTGINQLSVNSNRLSIYPNPAANQLTISSNQLTINRIEMTNTLGQVVYVSESNDLGVKQSVDVSTLAMGIYFVSVTCNNETVTSKVSVVR